MKHPKIYKHAFYLGILASAIHRRSMLQARTGRWGYGISFSSAPGLPLLRSTSIISCRLVSHLTGSPNRITPGRCQEMLGNSVSMYATYYQKLLTTTPLLGCPSSYSYH